MAIQNDVSLYSLPPEILLQINNSAAFEKMLFLALTNKKIYTALEPLLKKMRLIGQQVLTGELISKNSLENPTMWQVVSYRSFCYLGNLLDEPCPIFKGKKIGETHVTAYITPKSIKEIGLSLKKDFSDNPEGYKTIIHPFDKVFKNPKKGPYFAMMLKTTLVGTAGLSLKEHDKKIACLSLDNNLPYELPKLFEASFIVVAHYLKTKERLFSDRYINCQESLFGQIPMVGYFSKQGLCILHNKEISPNQYVEATPLMRLYC